MKNILLIVLSLYLYSNAEATVRTVCNMPYSPGQFINVNDAVAASNSGDTIYVHGSTVNYETLTLNKNGIVVIGPGHHPDKQAPMTASFTNIEVRASYCNIIGITANQIIGASMCNYTIVRRCKLLGGIGIPCLIFQSTCHHWSIEGNVFNSVDYLSIEFNYNDISYTTIRNNIFNGRLTSNSSFGSPTTTLNINHNLFLGSGDAFYNIYNAVINDNIFYRASPSTTYSGCTMNHNLLYTSPMTFSAPGINNLTADPLFISFPATGAFFDYSHDYHLPAISPAKGAASDGTDIGIYGGFGDIFNMSGEPAIAEITSFTITSPTAIPPGGTLNINVQSKSVR